MFTKKTIPFIIGSIILVAVAFLFLTRTLNWTYVTELYRDEAVVVEFQPVETVDSVKLEIAVMMSQEEYEQILKSTLRLRERMPHIHVNITNYANKINTYDEWVTALQLGELGDIQLVDNEWVIPLAIQGLHQPLDRLMNNDVLSDQLSSIVDAFRWNGYMWAIPYESNPYLIIMHKNAYNQIQMVNPTANPVDPSAAPEGDAVTFVNPLPVREPLGLLEYNNLSRSEKLWRFTLEDWLYYYEQMEHDGAFIALDDSNISSIFTILALWNDQPDLYFDIAQLSEQQLDIIKNLINNVELIESIHDWNVNLEAEQIPYLQVISFKQYIERREWYEQNYMSYEHRFPLPWLNGKSFMMSSRVTNVHEAMNWLEEMNRLQPENTLIHSKLYATFSSNPMQNSSSLILQEKLQNKQLFDLNPKSPQLLMDLRREWIIAPSLVEKLEQLYNTNKEG